MFFACIFAALLQVFVMTFLASQIMQDGVTLAKLVSRYHPSYEPHLLVMFRAVTPSSPEVIRAHVWNFECVILSPILNALP